MVPKAKWAKTQGKYERERERERERKLERGERERERERREREREREGEQKEVVYCVRAFVCARVRRVLTTLACVKVADNSRETR